MGTSLIELVRRYESGDIQLPLMQRDYVWTARCHHIPISFVPPHPDRSGVIWTENRIPPWRLS
jgi:hypothetical protein